VAALDTPPNLGSQNRARFESQRHSESVCWLKAVQTEACTLKAKNKVNMRQVLVSVVVRGQATFSQIDNRLVVVRGC
jgi:hypothetical protein